MCSRNPNYCGYNFCCCASTDCFNKLRYHFLRAALSSKKGTKKLFNSELKHVSIQNLSCFCFLISMKFLVPDVSCVVYRQRWIENNRSKRLNESFSPTSEQLYKRSDCTACVALVDAEGVEMTCSKEDIRNACRGMDLFVGGPVVCNKNGDCCCQVNIYRNFSKTSVLEMGETKMYSSASLRYL